MPSRKTSLDYQVAKTTSMCASQARGIEKEAIQTLVQVYDRIEDLKFNP